MTWLLLAAAFPALFWQQGPETIPALKRAGIGCVHVPAEQAAAWTESGSCHTPVAPAALQARETLPVPGVRWEINVASATRSPWVDSNGWRFLRAPHGHFVYELPSGKAALAAAEAFAYDADTWLKIDPNDLEPLGRVLAFLKSVRAAGGSVPLPALANFCVDDDGSALVAEVLNLLSRRNLLLRAVAAPEPGCDLNVEIGSQRYPKSLAANPAQFAERLRRDLTDEKRLLRIYGSDVVLGRLIGDGSRARLHLVNYGSSRIEGLRVRVLGSYAKGKLAAFSHDAANLEDYAVLDGATEFTIPEMGVYAVVDLSDPH